MTGRGIGLSIVLALALLIGLGTGTREFYFVVFCILLFLLYGILSALTAALSLRCIQSLDSPQAVRGERVGLRAYMEGLLVLPAVVRLQVQLPGTAAPVSDRLFQFTLLPGRRRPFFTMQLACPHRGVWPVGVDRVRVYDIFGLFRLPLLHKGALGIIEQGLTVYPQLFEMDGASLSPALVTEDSSSRPVVTDHGDSFAGTRSYRDGDSLKRIHWIQTVRTRELHTRQYEMSTQQYNLLLLDTGVPAGADIPAYADMAAECAGTLALHYLLEGQPVQLQGTGRFGALCKAQTADDFAALYTLLAEISFGPEPGTLELSELTDANLGAVRSIYVLTHRPSPGLLETLQILAGRRCSVCCLCPDFPYARQLAAAPPEDVRLLLITRPADILTELGDSL